MSEEITDPELNKAIDLLQGMGEVTNPAYKLPNFENLTEIVDGELTMRCACDYKVKTLDMPRRHSGVVPYIDNLCDGCEKEAKGLAIVVCATCHRVCGRLKPLKDQWGFKVEAGKHYHTKECPACQPAKFKAGQVKSPIIEMLLFHRRAGVKS